MNPRLIVQCGKIPSFLWPCKKVKKRSRSKQQVLCTTSSSHLTVEAMIEGKSQMVQWAMGSTHRRRDGHTDGQYITWGPNRRMPGDNKLYLAYSVFHKLHSNSVFHKLYSFIVFHKLHSTYSVFHKLYSYSVFHKLHSNSVVHKLHSYSVFHKLYSYSVFHKLHSYSVFHKLHSTYSMFHKLYLAYSMFHKLACPKIYWILLHYYFLYFSIFGGVKNKIYFYNIVKSSRHFMKIV